MTHESGGQTDHSDLIKAFTTIEEITGTIRETLGHSRLAVLASGPAPQPPATHDAHYFAWIKEQASREAAARNAESRRAEDLIDSIRRYHEALSNGVHPFQDILNGKEEP